MRRVLFLPSFDVAEILMLATSVLLIAALVYVISLPSSATVYRANFHSGGSSPSSGDLT